MTLKPSLYVSGNAVFVLMVLCVTGRPNMNKLCDQEPYSDVMDESIYILKPFRSGIDDIRCPDQNKSMIAYLQGSRKCPTWLQGNKTTCPTYNTLNYNEDRKPPMIVEVNCACQKCLVRKDLSNNETESINKCVPIFYYRNVEMKDKNGDFVRRVRGFKVGCECMGAETKPPLSEKAPVNII